MFDPAECVHRVSGTTVWICGVPTWVTIRWILTKCLQWGTGNRSEKKMSPFTHASRLFHQYVLFSYISLLSSSSWCIHGYGYGFTNEPSHWVLSGGSEWCVSPLSPSSSISVSTYLTPLLPWGPSGLQVVVMKYGMHPERDGIIPWPLRPNIVRSRKISNHKIGFWYLHITLKFDGRLGSSAEMRGKFQMITHFQP